MTFYINILVHFLVPVYAVEIHLSGLIGKANHQDMQKIWIIGFFFENG